MTNKEYYDKKWESMFDRFKLHVETTGTQACPPNVDYELNRWIDNQRMLMKSFSMRPDRRSVLEDYGFYVTEKDMLFDAILKELVIYAQNHDGSMAVPTNYMDQNNLGDAVQRLRSEYKKGVMKPEHEEKLRSIGFDFTHVDAMFRYNLNKLSTYPVNSKGRIKFPDERKASWFRSCLHHLKTGKLTGIKAERFINVVNSIGAERYLNE